MYTQCAIKFPTKKSSAKTGLTGTTLCRCRCQCRWLWCRVWSCL